MSYSNDEHLLANIRIRRKGDPSRVGNIDHWDEDEKKPLVKWDFISDLVLENPSDLEKVHYETEEGGVKYGWRDDDPEDQKNASIMEVQDEFPDITFSLLTKDDSGYIDGVLRLYAFREALRDDRVELGRPDTVCSERSLALDKADENAIADNFREMAKEVRDQIFEDAKKKTYQPLKGKR